jgi:orotidine-5'-phosphate decarboxylase
MHFADRLIESIRRAGAPACVGLDPVLERVPDAVRVRHHEAVVAIEEFCFGAIDAVAPIVAAIKPQSACFERFGWRGVQALERVCRHARDAGLPVILDAKRGDIGISAEHYAAAAVHAGAHAITVNAYLGPSTIEAYLKAGLGVFVLVRTSNPDSDVVQSIPTSGKTSGTVAEMMARHVASLGEGRLGTHGFSDVGAVVGATKAADGRALRAIMPKQFFLVPGFGAQGGTADDVRALLNDRADLGGGVIVNSSRGVLYPEASAGEDWRKGIARAALKLVADLSSAMG